MVEGIEGDNIIASIIRRISVRGSLHPHNGGHGVDSVAYLVNGGVSIVDGGEVEIIFPYVD